jgi:hypothetical protein
MRISRPALLGGFGVVGAGGFCFHVQGDGHHHDQEVFRLSDFKFVCISGNSWLKNSSRRAMRSGFRLTCARIPSRIDPEISVSGFPDAIQPIGLPIHSGGLGCIASGAADSTQPDANDAGGVNRTQFADIHNLFAPLNRLSQEYDAASVLSII